MDNWTKKEIEEFDSEINPETILSHQEKVNDEGSSFVFDLSQEDPEFVKDSRISFLFSQMDVLRKKINWWTANATHYGGWFGESILKKCILPLEKEKARIEKEIEAYKNPATSISEEKITEDDIEEAKNVPMDSILEFNNAGFAICIFHSDSHPSMKWWKQYNVVKCFSCGKSADTIGVIRKMYGYSFIEAVEYLKRF